MVPAWAVLNQLAHASPSELASLAEIDGRPGNAREPGEPALPSTIRPDAPGRRSRGGAASGHLAPSPTTQPRRTPLDRVGRCNPVHRSPALGVAEAVSSMSLWRDGRREWRAQSRRSGRLAPSADRSASHQRAPVSPASPFPHPPW
jgi:hypothetical protein